MRNSKGPRILPWGTPDSTGSKFEGWLFITTYWDQSDKYDLNQDQSLPEIPADHSLTRSWLWDTESKALRISK